MIASLALLVLTGIDPLIIGLDHIPIVVRDLERAIDTYKSFGFAIKPGSKHYNGIENAHIKFPDGTELELISVPRADDALAREYQKLLEKGEGPAFVSFYAPDLDLLSKKLNEQGREHVKTSTTITFPEGDPLRHIFFGKRQESLTDKPEHFAHTLRVTSLQRVWLADDNVTKERNLLRELGSKFAPGLVKLPMQVESTFENLDEAQVVFFRSDFQTVKGRKIIGVTLAVEDIDLVKSFFAKPLAPFTSTSETNVILRPEQTHGLWIEFRRTDPMHASTLVP